MRLSPPLLEELRRMIEESRRSLAGAVNAAMTMLYWRIGKRILATLSQQFERFKQIIAAYNAGSLNPEEFFRQLVTFAQSLKEEERRGVSEQLTEEELALFDLLMKPPIEMSASDREKVKATAKELLVTLKNNKLVA